ncbi:hypothetical protein PI95_031040 [Hassallia byssoidea VB512170]|uniref:Uncharacterized protein n=1 Tax=Hassallia byssoidea VB512170 TaxID=1304833 RepID=A0A846HHI3_9CYAN|nr:hypothetical protein [Hassalia byssoidea]NEU76826.1 hypothetical protein [Hassalia byssoidea VB512170]
MSNKFTNNVRTRLYKQGYQGFTKEEFTEAAYAAECDDLDNPTKEQLTQAVNYLIEKQSTKLAVPVTLSELETQPPLDEEVIEESKLATIPQSQVGEMVATKAAELGMVLSEAQVCDIADSVDSSASTFDEILSDVETALLAYADYSANQVDAKIQQTLTRVEERVVNRHEQSRDKLAQGLTGISAALEESRTQTKSQLKGILSRLRVG